jgi:hypothetical protein
MLAGCPCTRWHDKAIITLAYDHRQPTVPSTRVIQPLDHIALCGIVVLQLGAAYSSSELFCAARSDTTDLVTCHGPWCCMHRLINLPPPEGYNGPADCLLTSKSYTSRVVRTCLTC